MFDKRYQVSVTFFTVKKNFRTVECGYDEYEGTSTFTFETYEARYPG